MRLTICLLGVELLDIAINEPYEPDAQDNEPVQDSVQQPWLGDCTTTAIGFAPNVHPGWERPLNLWDEPSEGDEDA